MYIFWGGSSLSNSFGAKFSHYIKLCMVHVYWKKSWKKHMFKAPVSVCQDLLQQCSLLPYWDLRHTVPGYVLWLAEHCTQWQSLQQYPKLFYTERWAQGQRLFLWNKKKKKKSWMMLLYKQLLLKAGFFFNFNSYRLNTYTRSSLICSTKGLVGQFVMHSTCNYWIWASIWHQNYYDIQ